jgi:propanol-preferring alcohol dehydrogenase
MKAMILRATAPLSLEALEETDIPCPEPKEGQIRIRVSVCGVFHTELDEIEGRCPPSTLPMVPGHQVVGRVEVCGAQADRFSPGGPGGRCLDLLLLRRVRGLTLRK